MKQWNSKRTGKILYVGAILAIFLYAFRNVNQGIDVTDTGYHFSNFLYMSDMDPMWIFSTYLASILGNFFTKLPGGDTLLGLNIYTALIPALLGGTTFIFFTKVINLKKVVAFVAVVVAMSLCWCPTTCVYNYLTYLFFGVGAMLLYQGLIRDSSIYLVLAGGCLGINVLVRFPNLAEAALIVTVWFACLIRKDKLKEYFVKTGWCLLGYVLGLAVIFVQIGLQYGIGEYVSGIIRLLGMTGDASDYTLYSMLYNLLQAYIFSGRWVAVMAFCVGLGILGYMVWPGRLQKLKLAGYGVCCIILVRWFYAQGMFSLAYDGYGSIFNWSAVTIILALLLGLWLICSRKVSDKDKILSAIVIVVIGITPLGSNNQLYANINNMFLVVPFVCYALGKIWGMARVKEWKLGKYTLQISSWPFIIMTGVCLFMLCLQSMLFGNVFVFRDGVPRDSMVTNIPAVAYMETTVENAAELEELGAYVTEAGLTGRSVILFGDVPALSGYLRMPFVMSPWPDLASYSNQTFETELAKVAANMENNRPVMIFGADFYDFLTNQLEDKEVAASYEARYGYKADLLAAMITDYDYTCTFTNTGYAILE